jgi:hypothetical protein
MEQIETGELAWRLAIEQRSGTETAVLEGTELSGARLRIMVMPPGVEAVLIEVEGLAWPLGEGQTHPVALRLPSGARWPAHLRFVGAETMQVTVPLHGQRLLAGLRAARWVRIEHHEHLLMLTLPPRSAVDALQALATGYRPGGAAASPVAACPG